MMGKKSTAVREFVEEQLLDVYRDLENLGCKDLLTVEEQFQLIEDRVGFFLFNKKSYSIFNQLKLFFYRK